MQRACQLVRRVAGSLSGEIGSGLPAEIPRRRIQPDVFPGPLCNLPPHGKPVAGIGAGLILVPGSGQPLGIGGVAKQGHEIVGVPRLYLLLPFFASAPPGEHRTDPALSRFREASLSEARRIAKGTAEAVIAPLASLQALRRAARG